MPKKAAPAPSSKHSVNPKAAAPKGRSLRANPNALVKVRMYCQGLGDCFLLTFPPASGTKPVRVLIDCGVFRNSPGEPAKLRQVAEDIQAETGGEIDLLVITHEHWDHISGFIHAREIFDQFHFKNVWLSWAENVDDPFAQQIKGELTKKKKQVRTALMKAQLRLDRRLQANADDTHAANLKGDLAKAEGILEFFGADGDDDVTSRLQATASHAPRAAAKGLMSLGETMDALRSRVRPGDFCSPGRRRALPGAEDVKVYILGPPRSITSLRKEDPSKGQAYEITPEADQVSLLSALEWLDPEKPGMPPGPFHARHRISPEDARIDPFFRETYGFDDDPLGDAGAAWRRIDVEWLGGLNRLALQLDRGVNNTSLALAFELPDGRTLIFPGDAQIGHWLSWTSVEFKDDDGRDLPVTIEQLLNRAVLYKVGHHGSKNATLKPDGMEAMISEDLVAMIPTDQAYADTKSPPHGWKMPEPELNRALMACTHRQILRSDVDQAQFDADAADIATTLRWKSFRNRVEFAPTKFDPDPKDLSPPRPLYVEYNIPL